MKETQTKAYEGAIDLWFYFVTGDAHVEVWKWTVILKGILQSFVSPLQGLQRYPETMYIVAMVKIYYCRPVRLGLWEDIPKHAGAELGQDQV